MEGDSNNVATALCFGLATTKKGTIELPSPSILVLLQQAFFFNSAEGNGNVLFWSCCNKLGDGRVVITFYVIASFLFFFYYNAEGNGNKAVIALYFGLIATKKAMTKLSSL